MTFAVKQCVRIKRLDNSIFVKSNIKLLVEFTKGNLSRNLLSMLHFFNHVKELELSDTVLNGKSKLTADFFHSDLKLLLYTI